MQNKKKEFYWVNLLITLRLHDSIQRLSESEQEKHDTTSGACGNYS